MKINNSKAKNKVSIWSQIVLIYMPLVGILYHLSFFTGRWTENLLISGLTRAEVGLLVIVSIPVIFFMQCIPVYGFYRVRKTLLGLFGIALFLGSYFAMSFYQQETFYLVIISTSMISTVLSLIITHYSKQWNNRIGVKDE